MLGFDLMRGILCATMVVIGACDVATSSSENIRIGKESFNRQDFSLALNYFNRAVKESPQSDEALFWRGVTHHALGKNDKARSDLSAAVKINARNLNAHYSLGVVHIAEGDVDLAKSEFKKLLDIAPTYQKGYEGLGDACVSEGNWEGAIREYTRAIDRCGPSVHSLIERAECLRATGRRQDSIKDLDRAVKLSADSVRARRVRTEVAFYEGRSETVVEDATIVLASEPQNILTRHFRAEAYVRLHKWRQAVDDCDIAIASKGDDADMWRDIFYRIRGEAHLGLDELEKARADLTKAISLSDEPSAIKYYLRAKVMFALGRLADCVKDSTAGIDIGPAQNWEYLLRGQAFQLQGKHKEALNDFSLAIARKSANDQLAELHFHRSRSLFLLGDASESEVELQKAIDLDPIWKERRDW